MLLGSLLSLLSATASAAGFYHPDDIAAASARFRQASASSEQYAAHERAAATLAAALEDYALGVDLLGARGAGERDRLVALRREYAMELRATSAFAESLIDGFDQAFLGAMGRALAAYPGAVECAAEVAAGPSIPGMPGRTKKNEACQGENLSAAVAAAMDKDPVLTREVEALLARPWPELALPAEARPPVPPPGSDAAAWIGVASLFRAGAKERLSAFDAEETAAREPIDVALEAGVTPDEIPALRARADAIAADFDARRAAWAAAPLAASEKALVKLAPGVGWCANPAALGGCVGEDRTRDLTEDLLDNPKVAKAMARP